MHNARERIGPPAARPRRRVCSERRVESLEGRCLLATTAPLTGPIPNETLDQAFALGDLTTSPETAVPGSIGDGPYGGADVDWYSFTLDRSMLVDAALAQAGQGGQFQGIISLYNDDPLDFQDPFNPDGYRLLQQDDGSSSAGAAVDRILGPGSYCLAVSGAGNADFNPLLAGSGYSGQAGNFVLRVNATDSGPGPDDGPAVLTADPASGAVLSSSPFEIRLDLSGALDPTTILPGQNVQLTRSVGGTFAADDSQTVSLSPFDPTNFSTSADELQITPEAPLAPGYYKVTLEGDADANPGQIVLEAPGGGQDLGADATHPDGQDFSYVFQVSGIDGNTGPGAASDDTPATAHELGDVTSAGLVQVAGAIGVDPYYDPSSPDPSNNNPADQVDMYHFEVSGAGQYAFLAEVFAGRINSPLDPGVSLYQLVPGDPTLQFVAGNNNTYDTAETTDGQSQPIYSDSYLSASLTAGDYYLAVASGSNTPSPLENLPPGTTGLFDPDVSHSGQLGVTTGPYVLNLLATRPTAAPQVLSTSPADGASLAAAPTTFTVQFDSPVDIPQLAFQTFQETTQSTVSGVYVQGSDGTKEFPRFESYDSATNEATFLMLDRLAPGSYELHLSGDLGVTNLAGNPLVGNSPDGDYTTTFTVRPGVPDPSGDPVDGYTIDSEADSAILQDLGVLFPHELQAGVTVTRAFGQDPVDTSESYQFKVLQNEIYTFNLSGSALPNDVGLSVTDPSGQVVPLVPLNNGQSLFGVLDPGTYTITVGDWDADQSSGISYQLAITFISANDNAPPLVSGPVPALQLMLNTLSGSGPPDASPSAVISTPPPPSESAGAPGGPAGGSGSPAADSALAASSAPLAASSAPLAASTPPALLESAAAPGGSGSPAAAGAPSTSAPSLVSGPMPLSDAAAHSGSPTGGPESAVAGNASFSPSTTGLTTGGLIALSVAPVGSLNGNVQPSALAAAHVAFTLPSQPSSVSSLGEVIVPLVTTIQVLGIGDPSGPGGSPAAAPSVAGGSPALVFDGPLKRASEPSGARPGDSVTRATLDPTFDDLPPSKDEQAPPDSDEALLAAERTRPEETSEETAEAARGEARLAGLTWGTVLGTIVSISVVLIKRSRSARCGLTATATTTTSGPDRTAKCPEAPTPSRRWFAGPKGGRNLRSRIRKALPRKRAVYKKQGVCS